MTDGICQLHAEMRRDITNMTAAIGRIEGRQQMQLDNLSEIKSDISKLYENGSAQKQEIAIQRTKLTPLFWLLTVAGSVLITSIITAILSKWH